MMLVLVLGLGWGVGMGVGGALEPWLRIPWGEVGHAGRIIGECVTHHWHVHLHLSHCLVHACCTNYSTVHYRSQANMYIARICEQVQQTNRGQHTGLQPGRVCSYIHRDCMH